VATVDSSRPKRQAHLSQNCYGAAVDVGAVVVVAAALAAGVAAVPDADVVVLASDVRVAATGYAAVFLVLLSLLQ